MGYTLGRVAKPVPLQRISKLDSRLYVNKLVERTAIDTSDLSDVKLPISDETQTWFECMEATIWKLGDTVCSSSAQGYPTPVRLHTRTQYVALFMLLRGVKLRLFVFRHHFLGGYFQIVCVEGKHLQDVIQNFKSGTLQILRRVTADKTTTWTLPFSTAHQNSGTSSSSSSRSSSSSQRPAQTIESPNLIPSRTSGTQLSQPELQTISRRGRVRRPSRAALEGLRDDECR